MEEFKPVVEDKTNNKGLIITLIVVSGILLICFMVLGAIMYSQMKDLREENHDLSNYISDNFKLETEADIDAVDVVSTESKELIVLPVGPKLVKKTDDGEELVFLFGNEYDEILKWEDWLFSGDKNYGKKGDVAKVRAYNLETGESKIIFNLDETEDFKGQVAQYINNMDVFDGKLFISLGGYMMDGGIFYMDLTDVMDGEINFVGKVPNPSMEKGDKGFVVVAGEGDACWSHTEYFTVAKDFSKLNKVLEIEDNCGEGSRLIYKDGNKVVSGGLQKGEGDNASTFFTQVGIHYFFESRGMGQLINEDQMPEGITQIVGYEDRMFLVGTDLYQFIYSTDKLEKIVALPLEAQYKTSIMKPTYGVNSWSSTLNTICFNADLELDLNTKQFTELENKCWGFESNSTPSLAGSIPSLNLSKEYYYKK